MGEAAVQLKVAGKTYQVVTSAAKEELLRLAEKVEDALSGVVPPGREASAQALVLAAITLAHELEEERRKRVELEAKHRKVLSSLLSQVNSVLGDPACAGVRQEARLLTQGAISQGLISQGLRDVTNLNLVDENKSVWGEDASTEAALDVATAPARTSPQEGQNGRETR